jgi:hypothetical protein
MQAFLIFLLIFTIKYLVNVVIYYKKLKNSIYQIYKVNYESCRFRIKYLTEKCFLNFTIFIFYKIFY